ncbi:MAG: Gfo/Idh/MocA family protein [Thermomicrobiales bacterium]|jgi:predicted dehydrogenase
MDPLPYRPFERDARPSRAVTHKGPIRVAVIGTGFGAAVHIPALKYVEDTDVAAVCSRRIERARAVAQRHAIEIASDDWRDIVSHPDIDAVVIATPPYLHHQMAIAALEAGKHILCEKPLARSLAETRDLVRLAQIANVVAMVNHEFRYLPVRRRVKELIEEGYVGDVHSASVIVYRSSLSDPNDRPFGWLMEQDKAGGMLGASGSHHIDTLRWWLGDIHGVTGTTATAVTHRRLPDSANMARVDADDNFAFILKFASGAIGTVHYSATAPTDAGEETTISGSEGILIVQGDGQLYGARKGDVSLREIQVPERLKLKLPEFGHYLTRPTIMLMEDWARAMRQGDGAEVSPSFSDGEKVQEILDGVIKSSTQGRWIDTSGTRWATTTTF